MDDASLPPYPPTHEGLVWRGLDRSDLEEWFALVVRIQDHDEERERTTRDDVERVADKPYVDLRRDCLAAFDVDGTMRAIGRCSFRPDATDTVMVHLVGGVDPQFRGRGSGRVLLAWQCARARQIIQHVREEPGAAGLPALVGGFVEDHDLGRSRVFRAAGFRPTRWFDEKRRDLAATPPDHRRAFPGGLEVVTFGSEVSERVRVAHNEVFLDHWGTNPSSPKDWAATYAAEAFRPAKSFAVIDPSEQGVPVVAYVLNFEHEDDWESFGYTEGYTDLLGVRRAWRGRGLASALLQRSAEEFAAAGHRYATLHVDSENPSGAGGLYESLGYETVHRTTYWSRPVD